MASNSSALIVDAPANAATNAAPPDIRDIKPPVEIPSGWEWLWWTLGIVAAAVLAWLLWRRWRSRAQSAPAPVVPPHVRARQRLAAARDLMHDPKPFCIEVSDTIRVYLEERFRLRAPERTTEEFLHELQDSRRLTAEHTLLLADFLSQCDLVKFAKVEPLQPALEGLHAIAWRIVEETHVDPPAAGATGSAPGSNEGPAEKSKQRASTR